MGSFTLMKIHLLFAIMLIAVLLASCSSKRYGHYAYVKRKIVYPETPLKTKKKLEQTITIAASQSVEEAVTGTFAAVVRDTVEIEKDKRICRSAKESKNQKLIKEQQQIVLRKSNYKRIVNDTIINPPVTIRNENAATSMVMGIFALFLALFALAFTPLIYFAVVAGLIAFALAREAKTEIKHRPNLYSNEGEAEIGYYIGGIFAIVFIVAVTALVIIIAVVLAAIAIGIVSFLLMVV